MKTLFQKLPITCLAVVLLISATTFTSCKKDQTCRGNVWVYDNAGNKIPLALVRLDASTVNGQVSYTAKSDGNGLAVFDIALPAIFDVTVTSDKFPNMFGKGSLNVDEPRKENWTTVAINQ